MITKKTSLSLILSIMLCGLTQHCNSQFNKISPEIFKITRDTINVDIEGRLSSALLINNKYYAFYAVRDPNSSLPLKKFHIISKDGKIEKEVKVPEELHQDYYSYLRFWHGHIIANSDEYENKGTYFLNEEKGEFVKQATYVKVPLYEDSSYQVTCDCRGEFGSTTYFKNKSTGATYSIASECPSVINKVGYKYLINTSELVTIEGTSKARGKVAITDTELTSKDVFKQNIFDAHFFIPTSFTANGVLYHIYNSSKSELKLLANKEQLEVTKDTVKIGTIVDGKFDTLYVLKDHININLQQQLSPDYQICTFHTEERITVGFKKDIPPYKEAKYGFIEIKGNEIKIHYFFSKKDG